MRSHSFDYDNLGRVHTDLLQTGEVHHWHPLQREFTYTYDPEGGPVTVTGPDSVTTQYLYDEVGRLYCVSRGNTGAYYTYDPAGRLLYVQYTDGVNLTGAWESRTYDSAGRLQSIEHWDSGWVLRLSVGYTWNQDNTAAVRTEYDGTVSPERTITVEYRYDARRRLIEEKATLDGDPPETVYHYTYAYDPLGNRTSKYEEVTDRETWYAYDTDQNPNDPNDWRSAFVPWVAGQDFQTRNNRLVEYRESSPDGQRTVYYVYRDTGDVAHITVLDAGYDTVKDLYLAYGTDQKVGVAIWEEWRYDPNGPQIAQTNTDEEHTFPISVAIRDICGCDTPSGAVATYGNQVVTEEQTRFLAGLGIRGREDLQQSPVPPRFMHGDLIGSTMMETGPTGEVESSGGWEDSLLWQYTAFGEPIWPVAATPRGLADHRYKYGGAYGYEFGFVYLWGANENLAPILLLHVGERWYEPSTGRFVQRDPAGVLGGPRRYALLDGAAGAPRLGVLNASGNMYVYCAAGPLTAVDPAGEFPWLLVPLVRIAACLMVKVSPATQNRILNAITNLCVRLSNLGSGYKQPPINPPVKPPITWIDPTKL